MPQVRCLFVSALGLFAAASPARAQASELVWSFAGYLQQSWPKQTETNRQIKQDINGGLGTHFKTWDDVANLNVGFLAYRAVSPNWKVGLEFDYSQGRIHGREAVDDPTLGAGTVSFEQKYSFYADVLAMVQYRPFGEGTRWVPFVSGGVGFAYDRDTTRMGFSSSMGAGDFELLRVDSKGWFPMATLGLGVDAYLTERRDWYAELGLSYSWARAKRDVPATGLLAPGPTVRADTDSTGPNLWLGLGRRF